MEGVAAGPREDVPSAALGETAPDGPETPPPAAASDSAPIDWEKAVARFGGDEGVVLELAELFLAECPGLETGIREAIDAGNAADLRRHAHTLKGSAGVFMAEAAVAAAQRLEQMGRDGDLAAVEEAWKALATETDRLTRVLAERVAEAKQKAENP